MLNSTAEKLTPAQRLDEIATELRDILPIPMQTQNFLLNRQKHIWQLVEERMEQKRAQYPLQIGNALQALFALKQELFPPPNSYPVAAALKDRGLRQITNADELLQALMQTQKVGISLEDIIGALTGLPEMQQKAGNLRTLKMRTVRDLLESRPDEEVWNGVRNDINAMGFSDNVKNFLLTVITAESIQGVKRIAEFRKEVVQKYQKYVQNPNRTVAGLIEMFRSDPKTTSIAEAIQYAKQVADVLVRDGFQNVNWPALKMNMKDKGVPPEVYRGVVDIWNEEQKHQNGLVPSIKQMFERARDAFGLSREQSRAAEARVKYYEVRYSRMQSGTINIGSGADQQIRLTGLPLPQHLCEITNSDQGPMLAPKDASTPMQMIIGNTIGEQLNVGTTHILPPPGNFRIAIVQGNGRPPLLLEIRVSDTDFTIKYPAA